MMMLPAFPIPPVAVLARCRSTVAGLKWTPVGGGFSGADVWCGEAQPGEPLLALKGWPPDFPAERMVYVHRGMFVARQMAGLGFVPPVVPTRTGDSRIEFAGRQWDVTGWVPGIADFEANPSDLRIAAAMAALADLHRAWKGTVPGVGPCPAAVRRAEVLERFRAGAIPNRRPADPVLARAFAVVGRQADGALAAVRPFAAAPVPLQLCLRDVWHDHILYTGDVVTGLVDYGAIGQDHPAADVARLLGDLVGTDADRTGFAVSAYRATGGDPGVTEPFVRALAVAGLVGGVAGWLDRFATGLPANVSPVAALGRVQRLLDRLGTAA